MLEVVETRVTRNKNYDSLDSHPRVEAAARQRNSVERKLDDIEVLLDRVARRISIKFGVTFNTAKLLAELANLGGVR
jgi:hypothetical protein